MDINYSTVENRIEVITGCMFAGKTEELVSRATRAKIAGKNIYAFKPKIDNRYDDEKICTHTGQKIDAEPIETTNEAIENIPNRISDAVDVVIIDEANFFTYDLIPVIEQFAENNNRVILSGLDQTYRGEPFEPMPQLLAIADHVEKRHAICECCGDIATKTQRLIGGEPAPANAPTIDVGGDEKYEARCRNCHEIK